MWRELWNGECEIEGIRMIVVCVVGKDWDERIRSWWEWWVERMRVWINGVESDIRARGVNSNDSSIIVLVMSVNVINWWIGTKCLPKEWSDLKESRWWF